MRQMNWGCDSFKGYYYFWNFWKRKKITNKAKGFVDGFTRFRLPNSCTILFYYLLSYRFYSHLMLNPSLDASQWHDIKNLRNKTITLLGMGLFFIMFKIFVSRIIFLVAKMVIFYWKIRKLNMSICKFLLFLSLQATENLQNHFFQLFISLFWQEISLVKEMHPHPSPTW